MKIELDTKLMHKNTTVFDAGSIFDRLQLSFNICIKSKNMPGDGGQNTFDVPICQVLRIGLPGIESSILRNFRYDGQHYMPGIYKDP